MKVTLTQEGLRLLPESRAEQLELRALYAKGHAHFVCKYLECADAGRLSEHNAVRSLLLTPSAIEWARPEGKYERRRRA